MEKITGEVIYGIQKGRTLGYPTANIKIETDIDLGIYAGYFIINGQKHVSALYSPGNKLIEAFIFDFSENIYGQKVEIEFVKKIRDRQIFKNDAEAINQISKDVAEIKRLLIDKI